MSVWLGSRPSVLLRASLSQLVHRPSTNHRKDFSSGRSPPTTNGAHHSGAHLRAWRLAAEAIASSKKIRHALATSVIVRSFASKSTFDDLPTAATGPDLQAPQETPPRNMSLLAKYLSLSKYKLSSQVVISCIGGYLIAPGAFDPATFLLSTVGTALAIASANSINQYIEVDNDLLMKRTRNRMLPSGAMSLNHALAFGIITGAAGSLMLALGVNTLAAGLAFSNIILYTLVYTPLKRVHAINTWIGAVVGAIPPLIGWCSKTGALDPSSWVLAMVLFLWQLPHFFALSWPLRFDYTNAGYKMLSVTHPHMVSGQTLFYSILMLGIGPASWYTGLTTWPFIIDSSILNLWLIWSAYKFYQDNTNTSARRTFKLTLYYLPIFIILMLIHLSYWGDDEDEEKPALDDSNPDELALSKSADKP